MNTRNVPWKTWSEWEFVNKSFNSGTFVVDDDDDDDNKRKRTKRAIDLVQSWRVRGRVPLSIDCHSELLKLALIDEAMKRRRSGARQSANNESNEEEEEEARSSSSSSSIGCLLSEQQLRLSIAMVLIRMVNGICDSAQKGKFALSVQTIAQKLSITRTLVDIRHEATHNQLPSLQRLRNGVISALEWIRVNYWLKQERKLLEIKEVIKD